MNSMLKILLLSCLCCDIAYVEAARVANPSAGTRRSDKQVEPSIEAKLGISQQTIKSFVEGAAEEALKVIADPTKSEAQIKLEFKKIVDRIFDMEKICSSILGANRRALKSLDENESNVTKWKSTHGGQGYYGSFVSLAANMLIKLYCSKFRDYKDSKLRVTGITQKGTGNQFWDVTSILTLGNGKPPIKVIWTIRRNSKNQLKIFDAKVENVSMKTTLKDGVSGMISTSKDLPTFMKAFWEKYHQL